MNNNLLAKNYLYRKKKLKITKYIYDICLDKSNYFSILVLQNNNTLTYRIKRANSSYITFIC